MSTTTPTSDRQASVDALFGRIAGRYDAVNTLQSFGLDRRLRSFVGRRTVGYAVLDAGAGTGALASACLEAGAKKVVCLDRSLPMLRLAAGELGKKWGGGAAFVCGDVGRPPFKDGSFDAVVSAFLVRNLPDVPAVLAALKRVTKPRGEFIALDIFAPPKGIWGWLATWYFQWAVPAFGAIITGDVAAYRYLGGSIRACFSPRRFCEWLVEAGFRGPVVTPYLGGVASVVCGSA